MGEKVINGETYKVEPILATRAVTLLARLTKTAGPLAASLPEALASTQAASEEERNAGGAAVLAAITDIFASTTPEEFTALVKDVIEIAKIRRPSGNYDPVDFDGDFSTRFGSIIPVAAFVLTEAFGDFFTGLTGPGIPVGTAKR